MRDHRNTSRFRSARRSSTLRRGGVAALVAVVVMAGAGTAGAALLRVAINLKVDLPLPSIGIPIGEGDDDEASDDHLEVDISAELVVDTPAIPELVDDATALLDVTGALTDGSTQLFDRLAGVVCPLSTGLAADSPLADGACGLPAVDFVFVTRLADPSAPGGQLVRSQLAVANVPSLLNVDDDPAPDVIAVLEVRDLSLQTFRLRLDRIDGATDGLPLQFEAVIDDPTNGQLGREHIVAGFDAQGDDGDGRTPASWETIATLPEDGDDDLFTLDTTTTVTGAGDSITTLGGLFDGDPVDSDARTDQIGGALQYTPVPATSTLGLSLGSFDEVRAGASEPVAVEATAFVNEGRSQFTADVTIVDLPQSLRLRSVEQSGDRRRIDYQASAPVPSIEASITDRVGDDLVSDIVVEALDVPRGLNLTQTSSRSATFATAGGPLGSIEVGFGEGRVPELLDADHPYVQIIDDVDGRSFAGRVDELLTASVDARDGLVAAYELGPDGRKPFRALVDVPADVDGRLTIDGMVEDLPRRVAVAYRPSQGRIVYDAHGETIDRISLTATQDPAFFGRVGHIEASITGLPARAAIEIDPASDGFRAATTEPIGEVAALVTSEDAGSLPGELADRLGSSAYGAAVEDVPERFVAVARLAGIDLVDVAIDETGRIDGRLRHDPALVEDAAPTLLRYQQRDAGSIDELVADVTLSAIPADVRIAVDPVDGVVVYDGSEPLDRIDASVARRSTDPDQRSTPFFGDVRTVRGAIEGLPERVSVDYRRPDGAEGFRLVATDPADPEKSQQIAGVEVLLSSDDLDAAPTLEAALESMLGEDFGGVVDDTGDAFAAVARVQDLREIDVALTTLGDELQNVHAGVRLGDTPLTVRYHRSGLGRPVFDVDAEIDALPGEVVIDFSPADGTIEYEGSEALGRIDVDASQSTPFFGRVHTIRGAVLDLPEHVRLDFGSSEIADGQAFELRATDPENDSILDDGIGSVAILATSMGPDEAPALADAIAERIGTERRGLDVVDVPSEFTAMGHVDALRSVEVATTETDGAIEAVSAGIQMRSMPFHLGYRSDDGVAPSLDVQASLSAVPDTVDLTLDLANGVVDYDASAGIDAVDVDVRSSEPFIEPDDGPGANRLVARLTDLPESVELAYVAGAADGTVMRLESSAPLDVAVMLTSNSFVTGLPADPLDGQQGVEVTDTAGGFTVLARTNGLELISVDAPVSDSSSEPTEIAAELHLAPGPATIRYHRDRDEDLRGRVDITDLPAELAVTLDLVDHTITYDASASIARVAASLTTSGEFFPGAKAIAVQLDDVPESFLATYGPSAGASGDRMAFVAPNGSLGEAVVVATDRTSDVDNIVNGSLASSLASPRWSGSGAYVQDFGPGQRFTAARVRDIRSFTVETDSADKVRTAFRVGPQPLTLTYKQPLGDGSGDLTAIAKTTDIPSEVSRLEFDPSTGDIGYEANAPIDTIDLDVVLVDDRNVAGLPTPLFGSVRDIDATITGLPKAVDLTVGSTESGEAGFRATPHVEEIEVLLTDGTTEVDKFVGDRTGVSARVDDAGAFAVRARLSRVVEVSFDANGDEVEATLRTSPDGEGNLQDPLIDIWMSNSADAIDPEGRLQTKITDLPAEITVRYNGGAETDFEYRASSEIPQILVRGRYLPGAANAPVEGGIHMIDAEITGVPRHVRLQQAGDEIEFSTPTVPDGTPEGSTGIDRLRIEAWDTGAALGYDTSLTSNRINVDMRRGALRARADVRDLELVRVAMGDGEASLRTRFGTSRGLDLDLVSGDEFSPDGEFELDVYVSSMPTESTLRVDTVDGRQRFDWDSDQDSTRVNLRLSSNAVGGNMLFELPRQARVCIASTGTSDCGRSSPKSFTVVNSVFGNTETVSLAEPLIVSTEASGPIHLERLVLCIRSSPLLGPVPRDCMYLHTDEAQRRATYPYTVVVENAVLQTARIEVANGDSLETDDDGDPLDDGLVEVWLESRDDTNISGAVSLIDILNDSQIVVLAESGVVDRSISDVFFAVVDTDGPQLETTAGRSGALHCSGLLIGSGGAYGLDFVINEDILDLFEVC